MFASNWDVSFHFLRKSLNIVYIFSCSQKSDYLHNNYNFWVANPSPAPIHQSINYAGFLHFDIGSNRTQIHFWPLA